MDLCGGGETGFLRVSIKIILNEYFLLSWEIGTLHIFHLFWFTESWLNIRYLYSVRMWLYLYIHTKNMRNTWSGTTALDIIREKKKKVKKNFFPDQVRISLSYPPITVAAQGSARELRELNDHLKTFITLISQSKKFQNRNKVKTRWDRRRCSDHHTKGEEGWYFFQFHKMHIFGRFKKFPHVVEWKVWIDILKVFTYFQPSVIEM